MMKHSTTRQPVFPTLQELGRQWPWVGAAIPAVGIAGMVAWSYGSIAGINGFSAGNDGWLVFTIIGGCVLAWRLASGHSRSGAGVIVRPFAAAMMALVLCMIAVSLVGIIFLPGQSLWETLSTDAIGRSLPVAAIVFVAGLVFELVHIVLGLLR